MTEDMKVGWNHPHGRHVFEYFLGVGDGQGSLGAAVNGVANSQTRLSD